MVAAAQEERFTRVKHDSAFPAQAIGWCLRQAGVDGRSLDVVAFHEKPFLRFERLLETQLAFAPRGLPQFITAIPAWVKEKLWVKETIRDVVGFQGPILFPEHHQSHAASAFFPSPFREAAILTLDGVGEWATASFGTGENNRLSLAAELRFPHSLGLLYSAFTYYTGFRVNSGEYKVMGLAPYGEPKYRDRILSELMDLREDGSFRLNMAYFGYGAGLTMTNGRFDLLFGGPPREPESEIEQRHMDLARSVQDVTEEVVLRMARHVYRETGRKNLCLAGGVALNCVANGRVLREGPFENLWVQPASGDAGAALGAAFYAWHQCLGHERSVEDGQDPMHGSLLGPEYTGDVTAEMLNDAGAVYTRVPPQELTRRVAQRLADGRVVGWFQGRAEFGPRALGNRSILADPRDPTMQRRVNLKIKFREGFRPFAPAVLGECCGQYFDLKVESPYMLLVAPVANAQMGTLPLGEVEPRGLTRLQQVRSSIPAVTHVDGSARIQTVDRVHNPRFRSLIEAFAERTGCPVLVNTSFNVRGEPIVNSPAEAYRCFACTAMDDLVIGEFLLSKEEQPRAALDRAASPRSRPEPFPAPTLREIRWFGVGLAGLMAGLGAYRAWSAASGWLVWCVLGAAAASTALLRPAFLRPVYRLWTAVTRHVSVAANRVLLVLLYYTVVSLTALAARTTGTRFLEGGPDPGMPTYWIPRPASADSPHACERQS